MPSFNYKARDKAGALVTGTVDAVSAEALKESLFKTGLFPLTVARAGIAISFDAISGYFNRVSDEDMMIFVRQFYTLFKAGVSMDTILATMAKSISSKTMREAVIKIRTDISAGATLAQAFSRHPKIFDELFVAMIAAGEEAGILEQVLEKLSLLIQKDVELRKNVKGAILYPKIILTVLVGAMIFLMTFVVPQFVGFYGNFAAELPLPTRILMGISSFFRGYWYMIVAVVVGLSILYRRYKATPAGHLYIDKLRFRIPVFGELSLKVANARFGHIMASLYRSGLAMTRCLEVVANVIGNEAFATEVRELRNSIQKGSTLSEAMGKQTYFSPVMIETTAVGESAGALDDMLSTIAEHYDIEVAHTVKNLTVLLEPMLLIGIFGMVALLALAIFLPIWNMTNVVNK